MSEEYDAEKLLLIRTDKGTSVFESDEHRDALLAYLDDTILYEYGADNAEQITLYRWIKKFLKYDILDRLTEKEHEIVNDLEFMYEPKRFNPNLTAAERKQETKKMEKLSKKYIEGSDKEGIKKREDVIKKMRDLFHDECMVDRELYLIATVGLQSIFSLRKHVEDSVCMVTQGDMSIFYTNKKQKTN